MNGVTGSRNEAAQVDATSRFLWWSLHVPTRLRHRCWVDDERVKRGQHVPTDGPTAVMIVVSLMVLRWHKS